LYFWEISIVNKFSENTVIVSLQFKSILERRRNIKSNENHELGIGAFVHKGIVSAVKRVEFVSDRMSYIILRGRWCHIIVLNVHAPTEDKTDDVKDSFYKQLERVFNKFPKYYMKNF
jgi:hypothetical protein